MTDGVPVRAELRGVIRAAHPDAGRGLSSFPNTSEHDAVIDGRHLSSSPDAGTHDERMSSVRGLAWGHVGASHLYEKSASF